MKGYASAKVIFSAYAMAAIFFSNPYYYFGVLLSLLLVVVAYRSTVDPTSKKLVAISYCGVAIYSFVIGRLYFENGRLNEDGLLMMLAVLPVIAFVAIRAMVVEEDIA